MALSAKEKRIITDIEQNLAIEDLWWAWRFARRLRRFERQNEPPSSSRGPH